MSDQPPPPKPKPGSLRDRIAAFEKSAASTGPAPAPAPRPKPAGFQSWKPKVPSPPSSPNPSADNASTSTVKPGGMSASDAKESITKAGSLKDRMAALQGKGAFGAPPVPAAKPQVEKPKWKPPPVVHAPVDEDDDEKPPADVAAAVERTLSPPVKPQDESIEAPAASSTEAEADAATSQPTEEATPEVVDAEEEERQRRAAIAARMARLGGARVGMAPPVFGKKPPVRRPTQESEESKPAAEVSSPPPPPPADAPTSPPVIAAEIATSPPPVAESASLSSSEARSPEPALPVRKNSESVSILSADSADSQASRPPTSMPMAAVPRRTGPPRKKPAKAVPPPPPTEEVAEPAEATVPHTDVAEVVEKPVAAEDEKPSVEVASPPVIEEPEATIAAPEEKEPVVSPTSKEEPSDKEDEKVADEGLVSEALPPPGEQAPIDSDTPSPGIVSVQPTSISSIIETSVPKEEEGVLSPPPSRATPSAIDDELVEEDDGSEYSDEPPVAPTPVPVPATEPTDVPPAKKSSGVLVGVQDEEKPIEPASENIATKAEDVIDEEPESEDARKKRIAEKVAKMGGFNPFAPPPAHPAADSQTSPKSPPQSPPVALAASVPLPSSPPIPPATVTPSIAEALKQDEVGDEPSEASLDDESDGEDEEDTEDVPDKDGRIEHRGAPLSSPRLGLERQSVQATSSGAPHLPTHSQDKTGEDSDDSVEDVPETDDRSTFDQPSEPEVLPSPPPRPAQPLRRIIPQTPEPSQSEEQEAYSEDESDEDAGNDDALAQSHLFIPPPTAQRTSTTTAPRSRYTERDEDGNGSESDTPALPYRQRQSVEISPQRARSPLSEEEVQEPESDHDGQALPIRPRQPSGSLPKALDDEDDDDDIQEEEEEETKNVPFKEVTPMVAVSSSNTISDDEEGDPIDPSFHSPSRSPSISNLRAESQAQAEISSPPVPPPAALSPPPLPPNRPSPSSPPKRTSISSPPPPPPVRSVQPERSPPLPASIPESATQAADASEEDAESARRRTIAERMAKLGGIKFGAAPPALPKHRPPPPPQEQQDSAEQSEAHEAEEPPAALSEEEEERARKERIAAKMANMGGMRIGMLPMGMGQMPQQRSHVLREEDVARPPPPPQAPRAVPPSRPPPPTAPPPPVAADTDSEYSTEDGVKVEAEESEADEVTYDDVQEAEEEEAPPPIPSRAGRHAPHRQSTLEQPAMTSPTTSSFRPPVPTTIPIRKASVQSTRSGSMSETTVASPPRRMIPAAPSDFVMVDEPESQEEEAPPPPPRPTSRVPPSRSSTIPQPPILSQAATTESTGDWELTSNPMSNLDFGGGADLSLSWTDAGESVSPALPSAPPPRVPAKAPASSSQKQQPPQSLSADELMMVWGRVGVQICEAATTMFEKSKKGVVGDGTYAGFVDSVFSAVPSASQNYGYGYLVYLQNGSAVQKRASDIMPGDVVELADAKFKGHKGLQTYQQHAGGSDEGPLVGIVGEFEAKKTKIRVFQANHHVGQQTVESVSYRLEDLKSGVVKVYRVLEA